MATTSNHIPPEANIGETLTKLASYTILSSAKEILKYSEEHLKKTQKPNNHTYIYITKRTAKDGFILKSTCFTQTLFPSPTSQGKQLPLLASEELNKRGAQAYR